MTAPVPVDWADPCQRATALANAYYNLLSGQQEIEIQTRTADALDKVRFAPGNLDALYSELQAAQSACAAQQAGQTQDTRRFAIACRFKRRSPFGGTWYR